jgi:DNA-binding transcriptional MerR regulator
METDQSVTERTLEFWRHQGLLPRPERRGQNGKRPVWDYSPEAAEQLRALLLLRQQTKDPNVLRAALWYDGYQIEIARVRDSMSSYLRLLRETCEKELAKRRPGPADDPKARWQAIQAVAQVLAGKRGKGFPRLGRQALAERSAGIALTLGLLLGEEEAISHLAADAPAAERLIGVDRGRRFRPNGAGPWLDGPPEDGLEGFANTGSLDRLTAVVDSATDGDLRAARDFARTLLGGISAFSRIADALVGRDNASGMAGMRVFDGDPRAALFVVPLVLSILGSPELAQNLGQVLGAIQANVQPVEQQARELAAMSEDERAKRLKNLAQLPFAQQLRIKRLVAEFGQGTNDQRTSG